ncbi:MAG: hypothetical protein IKF00_09480, partial [Solobacterium sp.]|nr:hypothetical protein [Solobacterium sp.]
HGLSGYPQATGFKPVLLHCFLILFLQNEIRIIFIFVENFFYRVNSNVSGNKKTRTLQGSMHVFSGGDDGT